MCAKAERVSNPSAMSERAVRPAVSSVGPCELGHRTARRRIDRAGFHPREQVAHERRVLI